MQHINILPIKVDQGIFIGSFHKFHKLFISQLYEGPGGKTMRVPSEKGVFFISF